MKCFFGFHDWQQIGNRKPFDTLQYQAIDEVCLRCFKIDLSATEERIKAQLEHEKNEERKFKAEKIKQIIDRSR